MVKRALSEEDATSVKAKRRSVLNARQFNESILGRLQRAIEKDPEVDLMSLFPDNYADRLDRKRKQDNKEPPKRNLDLQKEEQPAECKDRIATVVYPLSTVVQEMLDKISIPSESDSSTGSNITLKLNKLIQQSEIVWEAPGIPERRVIMCGSDIVLKVIPNQPDYTEYTGLLYLEKNCPDIPAPRPHGLFTMSGDAYIFMSYIPGVTLNKVWPSFSKTEKQAMRDQLNNILLQLRTLPQPEEMSLGGVCGEGCKDRRRHTRTNTLPIVDVMGFENFIFSNPHFGGAVYIDLLRQLAAGPSIACFTHGDLRMENIVVKPNAEGNHRIMGILDWEMCGFYPDYFESIKATNTISSMETDDWYLFLPQCADPRTYPKRWLVDRLWDVHVA